MSATSNITAALSDDSAAQSCGLLTFEERTPLAEICDALPREGNSLVLVSDAGGVVLGIVDAEEIRVPCETGHEQERNRWRQMPVGALMPVRMPGVFRTIGWKDPTTGCDCREGLRETSALIAGGDVFINWRSLAPELREAFRDRLTGLPNRAGMELRLKQDWQRAETAGQPLAVLIIDLDHFKNVNDTLGHLFGDGLLQEVANGLKESLRSYDVITRYGGDEFVAICVGCSSEEITLPIKRIYNALGDIAFDTACELTVSASIGAAICRPSVNCHSEFDLLGVADDCLYAAKRHERGSTFCADLSQQAESSRSPELLLPAGVR